MPSPAYKYLEKLIRQRGYLLRAQIGNTSASMIYAFDRVKNYVDGMSLAKEEVIKNWIKQHREMIEIIIPRKDKNKKELDELTKILQS